MLSCKKIEKSFLNKRKAYKTKLLRVKKFFKKKKLKTSRGCKKNSLRLKSFKNRMEY
jgi:hypothetical protein